MSEELSLSEQETNALRAKLGLKPLYTTKPAKDVPAEAEESQAQSSHVSATSVKQRLERLRRERRVKEVFTVANEGEDDGDEFDLDPSTWVERMRKMEHAPPPHEPRQSMKKRRRLAENADGGLEMEIGHALAIQPGEDITLTLQDQDVLKESEKGLILEDKRTKQLQQYAKNVRERRKIRDFMSVAGPTGIAGHPVESDGELEEEENAGGDFGAALPGDEASFTVNHLDEEVVGEFGEDLTPPTKPAPGKLMVRVGGTADEPGRPTVPEEGQEAQKPAAKKFKQRRPPTERPKRAVDWGAVLDEAPEESTEQQATLMPLPTLFERPKEWKLEVEPEDADADVEESNALFATLKRPADFIAGTATPALESVELLTKVKQMEEGVLARGSEAMTTEETSMLDGIRSSIGTIDAGTESSGGVAIKATSEFVNSVRTPLEKLNEKRELSRKQDFHRGLRAVVNKPSSSPADDLTEFRDLPEETLEEVIGEEPMDMGMAGALKYITRKGDLDESRWALGRIEPSQKKPLHKDTGSGDVKIDYTDDYGHVMNPKEAFRYMSWKFHGKGPGKAKMERRLKRMELEHKLKSGDPTEVLPTMRALQVTQARGQAHLVLSSQPDIEKDKTS